MQQPSQCSILRHCSDPHPMRMLLGPLGIAAGIPQSCRQPGQLGAVVPLVLRVLEECPLLWRGVGVPGFPGLDGSCCPSLGEQRALVHPEGCSTREWMVLVGDTGHCTPGLG